jgi:CheY-like chemotaxis protein
MAAGSTPQRGRRARQQLRVDLPLANGAADADGGLARAAGSGGAPLSLMLVDDNVDAVTMLAALLAAAGHKVESFSDPRSALAAAPAAAPDAFILDIGMPGMDGYELARRLRAQPACRDASTSPSPAMARTATANRRARPASTTTSSSRWTPASCSPPCASAPRVRASAQSN